MKSSSRSSKRKPKRSQKHSKKKSKIKKEKIKKLKRRDYSVSCSDDEDSLSYSSGGEDDSGGRGKRRGRSSDRQKSRRDKKRSKKISLVNESSGDDYSRVKRSKRLKKDRSLDGKKKRRRERSVSSVSSRSRSRSGSGSEWSDDSEGGIEREDEMVEMKERKGREKRSGSKRSRRRSRSSSLCSLRSGEVSTPKRLKSVIVVMKERDVVDERESIRDDRREDEIVCEFDDDYPSRSNDSIDGVTGREAMPNLHDVSSKERLLYEPNMASDVNTLEGFGIQKQGVEVTEGITPQSTINDPPLGNISEVCTESAGSSRADLEATLRQKALENLLKRRGKLSAKIPGDEKGGYDIGVKEPSIVNAQHMHHHEETMDSVENVGKGDEHMPHDDGNIKSVQKVGKVVDDKHMARSDRNIRTEQKVGRGVDVVYTTTSPSQFVHKTQPSKHSDPHLLNMNVETPRLADKGKVSSNVVNGRPNVSLSMPRKEFLGGKNTRKRQLIPQQDCQENMSTPRKILINKDTTKQFASREVTEPTVSAPQETISKESIRDSSSQQFDSELNTEKVEADGRSDPSPFGEQSMIDKKNETNEENQFQQKTMSVMRGGEMVQVSYKVYIPTKTPALARRKLKR